MMFQKPKGTEDFYPQERADQQWVFGNWADAAGRYSFQEIEPPVLESMKLLTAKSGQEIREQIFTLGRRSKEELGLRFEFTAGAARMFAARQKEITKPVKWFSIGPVWRYEQPQAGRQREFFQFNAEIYGSARPLADAEVISLAIDSLQALGLKRDDFIVRVNNRKLLQGILSGLAGGRVEDAMRIIDKRSKISEKEFRKEMDFLDVDRLLGLLSMGLGELGSQELSREAREGFDEVSAVLSMVDAGFDLSTARGLAYYTGTVFEIFDKDRKYRALCGGGRYDGMIELLGGEKTPATGFGMGYSTVSLFLKEKGMLPVRMQGPDFFVASVAGADIYPVVSRLRKKYRVELDTSQRNLGNQMKFANSLGAKKVIVIGPEELESGKVKVRDMESGKEAARELAKL